jgi:hypothetical protein
MGHSSKTWAIPVDFTGYGIECASVSSLLLSFSITVRGGWCGQCFYNGSVKLLVFLDGRNYV